MNVNDNDDMPESRMRKISDVFFPAILIPSIQVCNPRRMSTTLYDLDQPNSINEFHHQKIDFSQTSHHPQAILLDDTAASINIS